MITLGVEDLARARAFYEALGWRSSAARSSVSSSSRPAAWCSRCGTRQPRRGQRRGPRRGLRRRDARAERRLARAWWTRSSSRPRAPARTVTREPGETFWGGYSASSPTPTGIPGRWLTTRTGRSRPTGRSVTRLQRPDPAGACHRGPGRPPRRPAPAATDLDAQRRRAALRRPASRRKPAASYSPRPLRAKYHRR